MDIIRQKNYQKIVVISPNSAWGDGLVDAFRATFEKNGGSGRKYTTALIAISASGQVLAPFIVYSGKKLINSWSKGGPSGDHYTVTKKVNIKLFFFYLSFFKIGMDQLMGIRVLDA